MNTTTTTFDYKRLPILDGTSIRSFFAMKPGDEVEIDVQRVETMHGLGTYEHQFLHIHQHAQSIGCTEVIEEYMSSTTVKFRPFTALEQAIYDRQRSLPRLTLEEIMIYLLKNRVDDGRGMTEMIRGIFAVHDN